MEGFCAMFRCLDGFCLLSGISELWVDIWNVVGRCFYAVALVSCLGYIFMSGWWLDNNWMLGVWLVFGRDFVDCKAQVPTSSFFCQLFCLSATFIFKEGFENIKTVLNLFTRAY